MIIPQTIFLKDKIEHNNLYVYHLVLHFIPELESGFSEKLSQLFLRNFKNSNEKSRIEEKDFNMQTVKEDLH